LRIAWWSPLPPQRSGISDYSYELLAEISKNIQAIAVVRDDVVALVRCPPTVPVIGMSDYLAGVAGSGDLDIYQMGNHLDFHGYMHSAARPIGAARPGSAGLLRLSVWQHPQSRPPRRGTG